MSKIEELYSKYAQLDTSKFNYEMTENLRADLKNIGDSELHGVEEHKQYLELLNHFRTVVKNFTNLNGDNYRQTIKDLLSVGSSGMYSSELRFLYELIQNVDDCEYADPANATLRIRCDDKMTFEYNEKGFSPFNVFAITGIAEQAKNIEPDKVQIGEKGLGFKTVFGVAKSVLIQSGYFSFRLNEDDFTCPVPDYENFEFVPGTKLILIMEPKKVYKIFQAFMGKYKAQDALLCKNPLLFLNKLSELRVYFDNYRSLKFTIDRHFDLNALSEFEKTEHVKLTYEDGKDIHEEITCTHYVMPVMYDRKTCISRYGKDTAFQTKKMNMQVIVPDVEYVKSKTGIKCGGFYSFLPTNVELPVPIVCHIPFKLDPSREYIDSQSGNKWFVYSYQTFSEMFDKVLKDLALTYKEDIVYYLPKKNEFLFKSDKEYADLELTCFKGEHFLTLPVFYTLTGGFLPADQIYAFSEPEKLHSIVRVAELLNDKRHLFNAPDKSIRELNIEIIEDVVDRLFQMAFSKPEYAEEVFKILSNYEGFSFDEKIKGQKFELDIRKVSAIFTSDKCMSAFKKEAYSCLKSGRRPEFVFACDKEDIIDVWHVDAQLNIEADDFGELAQKYFSWLGGYSCIVSDLIPAGEYFITKNVLILSKADTISALSSFCRFLDPKHVFAATLELRRCSKELDEVDDSLSAIDYFKKLRAVRKTIRGAFGKDIYNNYINLINQSGTDKERYINELLQNADDCEYPSDATPTFKLEVSKNFKKIGTRYNEVGFTKANVRAITAIGESTKRELISSGTGPANVIGEKGVGFKSVFAIADKVKIYSGEFNFELSASEPTIPVLINKKEGCGRGTTMLFELKEKMSLDFFTEEKVLRLCQCLRKLENIKLDEYSVKISDEDSVRSIQINDNIYKYKIISHKFNVDDELALKERRNRKREISAEQQILFYIPLDNKSMPKSSSLYSGLPTEIQVKVPLVIDAPFELDTARAGVIKCRWNNFILNKLYEGLKYVLLQLRENEGINVLRFISVKREGFSYLIDLFSNINLNEIEFLTDLKSLAILPTWKDSCFVSANKPNLFRVPRPISYALERQGIIEEDTSCFLKYRGDKYDEVLSALGVGLLPLHKTVDLLSKFYTDYVGDEVFIKHVYAYLKDQTTNQTTIGSVKEMLKKLKIIPIKGMSVGQTEYLSWNECALNLYVKDSATVSTDTCWILKTDILEKSLYESLFGATINELTDEWEVYTYNKKLLGKFEESLSDEELYSYILGEFKNNYRFFSKCRDGLLARKRMLPLKNQLGQLRKGKIYLSKDVAGYFAGELIPSHIVHKECESLAKFMQCEDIADIFHDDLDIDIQLSADDIETLQDSSDIHNGYEILRYCMLNGLISQEMIEKYHLDIVFSERTIEYDEEYVFNQPIKDKERFDERMRDIIGDPITLDVKIVPKEVRIGIKKNGEEVSVDYCNRRDYVRRKYAPKPGYCVCQMCKKAKQLKYIEVNNIEKYPKFHWEECGVALCLECSKRFEELREDNNVRERFHEAIKRANINSDRPIIIPIADEELTFSQSHLAEIQEILKEQGSIM